MLFGTHRIGGVSGYPSPVTTKKIKNEFMIVVKSLDNKEEFVTGWQEVDDEKLFDVLHNAVWIRGVYGHKTLQKKADYTGDYKQRVSGFFISESDGLSVKHGLNKKQCISLTDVRAIHMVEGVNECQSTEEDERVFYKLFRETTVSSSLKNQVLFYGEENDDCGEDEGDDICPANRFTGDYRVITQSIKADPLMDISRFKVKTKNSKFTPIELADCEVGENVLTIGFPGPILGDIACADGGYVEQVKAMEHIPLGFLSISKGQIAVNSCQTTKYLQVNGIAWPGWSGGMIVKASDPTKVCGLTLGGSVDHLETESNAAIWGICATHDFFH